MGVLGASVVCAAVLTALFGLGSGALPQGSSGKYHIADKVIHLKYGRLHLPETESDTDEDGHIRYKWLEDDILQREDDYDVDDEEEDDVADNMVKLPGGCEMTEDQYEELESFRKETHYVKKWRRTLPDDEYSQEIQHAMRSAVIRKSYCEQGVVYCQLSKNFLNEHAK